MPRDSDGKKIDELDKLTAKLLERLDATNREVDRVRRSQAKTAGKLAEVHRASERELAEVRREYEKEIALLKREIDELKRGQERWGQRLWMILAPLIAGMAGIFLAHYLKLNR